jgi:hypothetical protein
MTHYEITSMARKAGLFVPRTGIPKDGALTRFAVLAYSAGAAAELAALEHPEQAEPVAWWIVSKTTDEEFVSVRPNDWSDINWEKHPLYTHPPRQWQGLTNEEVDQMASNAVDAWECARTVEEKLRAKNSTLACHQGEEGK